MAAPMAVDFGSHGCIYNYHVTAHKPTAVTHCVVGSFTGANDSNLIIAYVGSSSQSPFNLAIRLMAQLDPHAGEETTSK